MVTNTAVVHNTEALSTSSLTCKLMNSSYFNQLSYTMALGSVANDYKTAMNPSSQRFPARIKFLTNPKPSEATAASLAAFLMCLVPIRTKISRDSSTWTPFSSDSAGISLFDYMMRLRKCMNCCSSCFVIGGVYVNRYILRNPHVTLTAHELHRLSLIAIVTAAKFIDDVFHTNVYYARIGGISLNSLNSLEQFFLAGLGYSLHVTEEDFFFQLKVQDAALSFGFAEPAKIDYLANPVPTEFIPSPDILRQNRHSIQSNESVTPSTSSGSSPLRDSIRNYSEVETPNGIQFSSSQDSITNNNSACPQIKKPFFNACPSSKMHSLQETNHFHPIVQNNTFSMGLRSTNNH